MVNIIGAPRTGSTLTYQLIVNHFKVCYFDARGQIRNSVDMGQVPYVSHYGKMEKPEHPSEASSVFKYWFGGGQPSQTKSKDWLEGAMTQCNGVIDFEDYPLLTKNAWNCFRIEALSQIEESAFIWIRRELEDAAASDLEARYRRGNPATVWNSATLANTHEIQKRPYWEQVVEQQRGYEAAIEEGLRNCGRPWIELWYSELFPSWDNGLYEVATLGLEPRMEPSSSANVSEEDQEKISEYIWNL